MEFSCRSESQESSNIKLGIRKYHWHLSREERTILTTMAPLATTNTLCILKKSVQLLPTTSVESIFPLREIILTSSFSNFCKMLLENRDAGTIHYILREIVVHISHGENGSSKQANMKLHFKDVIVQLLRVPSLHCISKHLAEPRQKLFEILVTQA